MYGNDWEYASSRLAGTIVRVGDEPVFVFDVMPGMVAEVAPLKDLNEQLQLKVDELCLVPVPLGMCNFQGQAHYLSRLPMRRDWKQGLRKENFMSKTIPVQLIKPDALRATIIGSYPDRKKCLEYCRGGATQSAAWHRHWALDDDGKILYKAEGQVGEIVGDEFVIWDRFRYLREAFEEAA